MNKRGKAIRKQVRNRKENQDAAYGKGYNEGYDRGYEGGYSLGLQQGTTLFPQPLDGVSIIIPTFNQGTLLKQCLDSIARYTPEQHEVIVIDNASTDGTNELAKSFAPNVRYVRMSENLGFAGGINQGLRLAHGSYLLLLNNDTVVTPRWFAQLKQCLDSSPDIGLVGPVTNYISGKQKIPTSYGADLEAMQRFAEGYNHSAPALWEETDRLTGFCVLMKREMFERLGYWDEGFAIGNFEDDDYGLRTRLLGQRLIVAGDTFIHHVGSVSMKGLGESFSQVNEHNAIYYSMKWGAVDQLLSWLREAGLPSVQSTDLFPTKVLVHGLSGRRYWLVDGVRYPVDRGEDLPAVRLSHVDLRLYPLGVQVSREAVLEALQDLQQREAQEPFTMDAEGVLVRGSDGLPYQIHKGHLRPLIGREAVRLWGYEERWSQWEAANRSIELSLPKGLPIIVPPVLKAGNL